MAVVAGQRPFLLFFCSFKNQSITYIYLNLFIFNFASMQKVSTFAL